MVGVDFGDDERDILVHAEILGIAQHEPARARERCFDIRCNGRIERGKDQWRADLRRIAREHRHARDVLRHHLSTDPSRCIGIALGARPLRRGKLGELEPRMIREQANEALSHGARRAEHRNANLLLWSVGHEVSTARTIRSYASTAARSSAMSMYSSVVWAT